MKITKSRATRQSIITAAPGAEHSVSFLFMSRASKIKAAAAAIKKIAILTQSGDFPMTPLYVQKSTGISKRPSSIPPELDAEKGTVFFEEKALYQCKSKHWKKQKLHVLPGGFVYTGKDGGKSVLSAPVVQKMKKRASDRSNGKSRNLPRKYIIFHRLPRKVFVKSIFRRLESYTCTLGRRQNMLLSLHLSIFKKIRTDEKRSLKITVHGVVTVKIEYYLTPDMRFSAYEVRNDRHALCAAMPLCALTGFGNCRVFRSRDALTQAGTGCIMVFAGWAKCQKCRDV